MNSDNPQDSFQFRLLTQGQRRRKDFSRTGDREQEFKGPEPVSELWLALFFWGLAIAAAGVMSWLLVS